MFEDGRIAYKRFVELDDGTGEVGTFTGYSTYTFQAGDSRTLSYTGGWGADGVTGKYQVISGTGEYAGATGTGEFKSVEAKWDEALLFDGSFSVTLASQSAPEQRRAARDCAPLRSVRSVGFATLGPA